MGWVDLDFASAWFCWADGKFADVAQQLGKMEEHLRSKSTQLSDQMEPPITNFQPHRLFEVEGNDLGPERDLGEAAELDLGGHVLRHVPQVCPQRGHSIDEAADAALGAAVAPAAVPPAHVAAGRRPQVVQLLRVQLKRDVRCLSTNSSFFLFSFLEILCYREVQLELTPELEVSHMLSERCHM